MAPGTLADLAAHKFCVPGDKLDSDYRLSLSRDVAEGPDRVPSRVVARLKGLISSSWVVGSRPRDDPDLHPANGRIIESRAATAGRRVRSCDGCLHGILGGLKHSGLSHRAG